MRKLALLGFAPVLALLLASQALAEEPVALPSLKREAIAEIDARQRLTRQMVDRAAGCAPGSADDRIQPREDGAVPTRAAEVLFRSGSLRDLPRAARHRVSDREKVRVDARSCFHDDSALL
jgi:hypothetical protein